MTQAHGSSSPEFAGELPPGSAPAFGMLPEFPFEHTPERLVLSSEEHSHLTGGPGLAELGGEFASERYGSGILSVSATGAPAKCGSWRTSPTGQGRSFISMPSSGKAGWREPWTPANRCTQPLEWLEG